MAAAVPHTPCGNSSKGASLTFGKMRTMCRCLSASTHLERTAGMPRGQELTPAIVREVRQLSPSTRGLLLEVQGKLNFHPGQWVDMHIPGVDVVGGYSITSVPKDLPFLQLAVKASKQKDPRSILVLPPPSKPSTYSATSKRPSVLSFKTLKQVAVW